MFKKNSKNYFLGDNIDMTSENKFLVSGERFDADKLNYIVENFDKLKKQFRPSVFNDPTYDPLTIAKKYLEKSRGGKLKAMYRQNDGIGRFCAVGSMSLQSLTREIRHTISKGYYIDIDIKNAHPVILSYLCSLKGFSCEYLNAYILDREKHLQALNVDREKAKQVYLALTNGGEKDYMELENKTEHIKNYRKEMKNLHKYFSYDYPSKFTKCKEKRVKDGKDYNHEAAFMNILLCDMENKILMCMYDFFGKPDNCVLCFDGLMLEYGKDYDINGCCQYVKDNIGIEISLCIKEFDKALSLPYNIPKYNELQLEYFNDSNNLADMTIPYEWLEEWTNKCLSLVINGGKMYILTKNKRVIVYSDGTKEITDEWKPVKIKDIEEALDIDCKVKNPYYNYEFCEYYFNLKPREKKLLDIPQEEIDKKINKYLFDCLGKSIGKERGYLTHILKKRKINTYTAIDFLPYLNKPPNPNNIFNMFVEYPMKNRDIEYSCRFEDSYMYKHLQNEIFNDDNGEFNHFLDHIADMVQDPIRIKGIGHIFYGPQGSGKSYIGKGINKILGSSNVISIINTNSYFESDFNIHKTNKILKIFEEVSDKGKAFSNHDRLKGEITSDTERIEPKGIDAYYNRHCARYWFFSNNKNSLYVENDDRRFTFHQISGKHAQDKIYFEPLWKELEDEKFLKCAFDFFATRKYEMSNVMTYYPTNYKKEQKLINLSGGIKFMIQFIQNNFDDIVYVNKKVSSRYMKDAYKQYCIDERQGRYNLNTLHTQVKNIGVEKPKQLRIDGVKSFCYSINPYEIQERLRHYLRMPDFEIFDGEIENVLDEEVLDY